MTLVWAAFLVAIVVIFAILALAVAITILPTIGPVLEALR